MTLCGFEQVINEVSAEYNNGWTPCSVVMPPVETEVLIITKRKYKGGDCIFIITTAMYEDGTVLENDSCWNWEDIEGEWDEKNDCYIIPEGWWENRHYNPDDVYNNVVDDEVIAWKPLQHPSKKQRVYDLRYIASMNVDRCRAEAELRELKNKKYSRTNADRIRSMSDEELADYIFGVSVHEKPCVLCSDDCDFCELTDEECKNRTLEWLQSEVEE